MPGASISAICFFCGVNIELYNPIYSLPEGYVLIPRFTWFIAIHIRVGLSMPASQATDALIALTVPHTLLLQPLNLTMFLTQLID